MTSWPTDSAALIALVLAAAWLFGGEALSWWIGIGALALAFAGGWLLSRLAGRLSKQERSGGP